MDIAFTEDKAKKDKNTAYYNVTPIKFCCVGATGVGKTSMLTSMYHELDKGGVSRFSIDTTSELGRNTTERLQKSKMQMLRQIDNTEPFSVVEESGIASTRNAAQISEFIGSYEVYDDSIIAKMFGKPKKSFSFPFHFIDMPGEWYEPKHAKHPEAVEHLRSSLVSFIAVDTPALMENDAMCQESNLVLSISELYKGATLDKLKQSKHSVIFVLSKCEHLCKTTEKVETMLKRLDQSSTYGLLIKRLKDNGIPVYVTWIQTLGGLEFFQYKSINEDADKMATFIKTGSYAPDNCAAPLMLALKYGLKHAIDTINTIISDSYLQKFLNAMGWTNKTLAIKAAESLVAQLGNAPKYKYKKL